MLWVLASGARTQANLSKERKETTAESEYEWGTMWMEGKESCQNVSERCHAPSFGGRDLGQIGQQLTRLAPLCSQAHNGSEGHRWGAK